jgi:putative sigma-54 modulation protein
MSQNIKFESEGYNVSVVGKNVEVTDAIEGYVLEKLSKMERFTKHILEVSVTLDVQKLAHSVSILMKFLHFRIKVQATTEDLYSAIDKATDRLVTLIEKYKNKLQNHKGEHLSSIDMKVNVLKAPDDLEEINEAIDDANFEEDEKLYEFHKVVESDTIPLKNLTQEEAVMKIELSDENFLIYKSEEDLKMKVIYKREDKNLGIIEIENND